MYYFTSANARVELDNFKDTLCKLSKEKPSKTDRDSLESERKEELSLGGLELNSQSQGSPSVRGATITTPTTTAAASPLLTPVHTAVLSPTTSTKSPKIKADAAEPQQRYNTHSTRQPIEQEDVRARFNVSNGGNDGNSHASVSNNNHNISSASRNGNKSNARSQDKASRDPYGSDNSEEDDFFSIKEDQDSGRGNSSNSGFEIEVRDPQKETDTGGNGFVSYP